MISRTVTMFQEAAVHISTQLFLDMNFLEKKEYCILCNMQFFEWVFLDSV